MVGILRCCGATLAPSPPQPRFGIEPAGQDPGQAVTPGTTTLPLGSQENLRRAAAGLRPVGLLTDPSGKVFCSSVTWITGRCAVRVYAAGTYPIPGGKMSAHSAVLVQNISAAWLRNAFAGSLAALVVVLLLILVP